MKNLAAIQSLKLENAAHHSRFPCSFLTLKCLRLKICSFDCSSFINRDSSKCFYNNQVFNISGNLDSPDITSSCTAGCRCVEADEYHPKANFLCTHIDCPEFFGESMETSGEECIAQHQLNSCCSTGSVCGEERVI